VDGVREERVVPAGRRSSESGVDGLETGERDDLALVDSGARSSDRSFTSASVPSSRSVKLALAACGHAPLRRPGVREGQRRSRRTRSPLDPFVLDSCREPAEVAARDPTVLGDVEVEAAESATRAPRSGRLPGHGELLTRCPGTTLSRIRASRTFRVASRPSRSRSGPSRPARPRRTSEVLVANRGPVPGCTRASMSKRTTLPSRTGTPCLDADRVDRVAALVRDGVEPEAAKRDAERCVGRQTVGRHFDRRVRASDSSSWRSESVPLTVSCTVPCGRRGRGSPRRRRRSRRSARRAPPAPTPRILRDLGRNRAALGPVELAANERWLKPVRSRPPFVGQALECQDFVRVRAERDDGAVAGIGATCAAQARKRRTMVRRTRSRCAGRAEDASFGCDGEERSRHAPAARRMALRAQGFGRPRLREPGSPTCAAR
jgi:hypothetical protein